MDFLPRDFLPVEAALTEKGGASWYQSGTASMPGVYPVFNDGFAQAKGNAEGRVAFVVTTGIGENGAACCQPAADILAEELKKVMNEGPVTQDAINRAFAGADSTLKDWAPEGTEYDKDEWSRKPKPLGVSGVSVSAGVLERQEDGTVVAFLCGLGYQTAGVGAPDGTSQETALQLLTSPSEVARVEAAGGQVKGMPWPQEMRDQFKLAKKELPREIPAVGGSAPGFATSRGLGFHDFKEISCVPDVRRVEGLGEGAWLMLGSQGMFKYREGMPEVINQYVQAKDADARGEKPVFTDVAWMDIKAGGKMLGRIKYGLYGDAMPKTVENFKALCTSEKGFGYKGSTFTTVRKGSHAFGGFVDGGESRSIFPDPENPDDATKGLFDVESWKVLHQDNNMISMAPANSSQHESTAKVGSAFIVTKFKSNLYDMMVPGFGRIVEGSTVFDTLLDAGVEAGSDTEPVECVIADCGVEPYTAGMEEAEDKLNKPEEKEPDGDKSEKDVAKEAADAKQNKIDFRALEVALEMIHRAFQRQVRASQTATMVRIGHGQYVMVPHFSISPGPWETKEQPDELRRYRDWFAHCSKVMEKRNSLYKEAGEQLMKDVDTRIEEQDARIKKENKRKKEKEEKESTARVLEAKQEMHARLGKMPDLAAPLPPWEGSEPSRSLEDIGCMALLVLLVLGAGFFMFCAIQKIAKRGVLVEEDAKDLETAARTSPPLLTLIGAVVLGLAALRLRAVRQARRHAVCDDGELELPLVAQAARA